MILVKRTRYQDDLHEGHMHKKDALTVKLVFILQLLLDF